MNFLRQLASKVPNKLVTGSKCAHKYVRVRVIKVEMLLIVSVAKDVV
jgi:hypothetical protein